MNIADPNEHGGNIYAAARITGAAPGELLDYSANINPLGMPPAVPSAVLDALASVVHYPDAAAAALKGAIARRYGVSVTALARANQLDPRRVLRLGARLAVPVPAAPSGYPTRLLASPSRLALVPHFQHWAKANAIPADLLMATTWLESGWQNGATSSVGAIGIGQLMPGTVRFIRSELIGVDSLDPRVPEHNIRMSARYLRFLLQRSGGDVRTALAAYYQGPGSVDRIGAQPGTVAYVNGVLALRRLFTSATAA